MGLTPFLTNEASTLSTRIVWRYPWDMPIRARTGDAKTLIIKRHLSYNRNMLTQAGELSSM